MGSVGQLRPLVALLRRGLVTRGDVDEFMHLLRVAVRADAIVADTGWGFEDGRCHLDVPADWRELYDRERFMECDPALAKLTTAPLGTWYVGSRDSPTSYFGSQMEAAFVDQFKEVAVTRVSGALDEKIAVVVYRERAARAFSDDEIALLELLSPHFHRGLGGATARRALRMGPGGALHDVLDGADGTAMVSLRDGSVTWSATAREMWRRRLAVTTRAELERVGRMVHRAALRCLDAVGPPECTLPGGVRATVVSTSEDEALVVFQKIETPVAVPGTSVLAPVEELLTPRQREVARALARGVSVGRIAADLGLHVETVRDHRDAVYRRLCIGSRAELAALFEAHWAR